MLAEVLFAVSSAFAPTIGNAPDVVLIDPVVIDRTIELATADEMTPGYKGPRFEIDNTYWATLPDGRVLAMDLFTAVHHYPHDVGVTCEGGVTTSMATALTMRGAEWAFECYPVSPIVK